MFSIHLSGKVLAVVLSGILVLPLRAGPGGDNDIIDAGGARFEIEVPPMVPIDTGKQKERKGSEPLPSVMVEESGAGQGYVVVSIDTLPSAVYLDGQEVMIAEDGQVIPLLQGRHYLSLFSPKQVYLTFREEAPEGFWRMAMPGGVTIDRFGLISSYERDAVRVGTRWVQVVPDDTVAVHLSQKEVQRTYRRQATVAAITFFSVATIIASAMFGSVALIERE